MSLQKGANAELGGKALCQFILRPHRRLEMVEPIVLHEHGVRHIEEGGHPSVARLFRDVGTERGQEDLDGLFVVIRKMLAQRPCNVPPAGHEFQRFIIF